jgi:hypothetical protein
MSSQPPPAFELPDEAPISDSDSGQRSVPGGSGSGLSHGAKTRKPAFRKRQFRFGSDSELALLREISVSVPWEAQYGDVGGAWDAVAKNLRTAGHNVDGKRAKAKAFALIKNWRSTSTAEERQSGVDVPYAERQALLEDIKERMDEWTSKERTEFEAAAKIKSDSEKKGKDLREASMNSLKRRRDHDGEGSDSNNEKVMSIPRKRKAASAFEESFESLKDGVLSSIEDKKSIREREIDLETRRMDLEEKKMKMEVEERAAARETQRITMNAMLSLMNTLSDRLSKQ